MSARSGKSPILTQTCQFVKHVEMVEYNKKRRPFSKRIKNLTLRRQKYKCNKCKRTFSKNNKAQFDHINGKRWDNSSGNCQALHAGCHDVKSRKANSSRVIHKKTTGSLSNPFQPFTFNFKYPF